VLLSVKAIVSDSLLGRVVRELVVPLGFLSTRLEGPLFSLLPDPKVFMRVLLSLWKYNAFRVPDPFHQMLHVVEMSILLRPVVVSCIFSDTLWASCAI
jgi:hypothetical protein